MKNFLRWLNPRVWWYRHLRFLDRKVLFREIKEQTENDKKKIAQAILRHIQSDKVWQVSSWELSEGDVWILFGMFYWLGETDTERKTNEL